MGLLFVVFGAAYLSQAACRLYVRRNTRRPLPESLRLPAPAPHMHPLGSAPVTYCLLWYALFFAGSRRSVGYGATEVHLGKDSCSMQCETVPEKPRWMAHRNHSCVSGLSILTPDSPNFQIGEERYPRMVHLIEANLNP